jgi:hypothetical protein
MSIRKIVHEGEELCHSEVMNDSESISWELQVEEDLDIRFSIRARTISSALKSAWTVIEPHRTMRLKGELTSTELREDGVCLPVMLEFKFDNSFSWFNPKQIVLTINRKSTSASPMEQIATSLTTEVDRALSRSSSVSTPDIIERRRADDSRTKMDLMWMQQVLAEAVERCPNSMPVLRVKLQEAQEILLKNKSGVRSPSEPDASI